MKAPGFRPFLDVLAEAGFDFPPLAEPSPGLKERVRRRWREYGLP